MLHLKKYFSASYMRMRKSKKVRSSRRLMLSIASILLQMLQIRRKFGINCPTNHGKAYKMTIKPKKQKQKYKSTISALTLWESHFCCRWYENCIAHSILHTPLYFTATCQLKTIFVVHSNIIKPDICFLWLGTGSHMKKDRNIWMFFCEFPKSFYLPVWNNIFMWWHAFSSYIIMCCLLFVVVVVGVTWTHFVGNMVKTA